MLDMSALSSANGCRYYGMLLRYVCIYATMECRVQCKVSSAVVTHLK